MPIGLRPEEITELLRLKLQVATDEASAASEALASHEAMAALITAPNDESAVEPTSWACSACTFQNCGTAMQCEMCGNTRVRGLP
eukprot:CAMPEP_0181198700 /NCGR_PEP_ID=MMETSP1096-20121128/16768_1 /TAXON_ID=156174 ORGANISM="Chrysochromulina ericina, Strain CCMP281" /NCGR_SAMPLE_ID=MMETSP1096 /ASSEMBLY_ACC=CAM_ASM_000453 /LENGTH=84 /DNA_ID=CAMNT_0023288803 /DNA_START=234 /DNA_END=488 /DNA_ORIENTATION=+